MSIRLQCVPTPPSRLPRWSPVATWRTSSRPWSQFMTRVMWHVKLDLDNPKNNLLRERTTPLWKHLDHTHSQKSGIRMDTTTLTDPESENKADKAKTLPLANTQGNRGDQQQVGSHTSILRKTRKSGSSKIPRSGGTNPHGYNPGPTEVIVSSPRLSRSVYQSFSRLLISLFQGYPTVLLRTAFLCLFSEKDRVLSLPVTMELTIDARHQKHFSLTD